MTHPKAEIERGWYKTNISKKIENLQNCFEMIYLMHPNFLFSSLCKISVFWTRKKTDPANFEQLKVTVTKYTGSDKQINLRRNQSETTSFLRDLKKILLILNICDRILQENLLIVSFSLRKLPLRTWSVMSKIKKNKSFSFYPLEEAPLLSQPHWNRSSHIQI